MPIVKKKINPGNRLILSPIEKDILKFVGKGKTNGEIGHIIGETIGTVKIYLKNIMKKLNVISRTQAVSKAIGQGLLSSFTPSGRAKPHPKRKVCIVGLGKGGWPVSGGKGGAAFSGQKKRVNHAPFGAHVHH